VRKTPAQPPGPPATAHPGASGSRGAGQTAVQPQAGLWAGSPEYSGGAPHTLGYDDVLYGSHVKAGTPLFTFVLTAFPEAAAQ